MKNSKNHSSGYYVPTNKGKYVGDITKIRYLSSWERMTCRFFDFNPDVQYWSSETAVVSYVCPSDGGQHRYYIDFTVKYFSGKILLIEVKPSNQTTIPKQTKGRSKKTVLTEHLTFMKNKAKWLAADKYAKDNGAEFQVWTEHTLKRLGMPII